MIQNLDFCIDSSFSLIFNNISHQTHLNFPSKLTQPLDLQSTGMEHISTEESGRSNGRNDSVWAHIGVSKIAGTEGWTMDPPAAREYAVDPKGEERKERIKR